MPWRRALPERVAFVTSLTELGEVKMYLKACDIQRSSQSGLANAGNVPPSQPTPPLADPSMDRLGRRPTSRREIWATDPLSRSLFRLEGET